MILSKIIEFKNLEDFEVQALVTSPASLTSAASAASATSLASTASKA